ncbi:MAG: PilZ domain-containing protein [Candidatus Aureabacteria bacterium]|nr:PilZ domain-containing protein [Candidatus Auribacterota bacterium]
MSFSEASKRPAGKRAQKRAAPRVDGNFPVFISRGRNTLKGESRNVSSTGLACTSRRPLPLSSTVRISLALPPQSDEPREGEVVCRAQVVRVESPRGKESRKTYLLAFNFYRMAKADRDKLDRFISEKLNQSGSSCGGIVSANAAISPNGIGCTSDSYIPLFHEVRINVSFFSGPEAQLSGQAISCSGVVVSCEKIHGTRRYWIELYFTDIERKHRLRLRRYFQGGALS